MDDEQTNKTHKMRTKGQKADKKELNRKKKLGLDLTPNRGKDVKAFTGPNANSRKARQQVRSSEHRENALRMPAVDKTFSSLHTDPPLLVAVVGPPKSGKTTLIRSMIKFYSNRNIKNMCGPATVVAGRNNRITFLECPNNLHAMCDVAKVADLVILMVDGSFGFEMETFEFLNIAQVHGFPKMIGCVSKLDKLPSNKTLKRTKKLLRHRFWHEVAAGAKLLTLSPMHHGMYRPSDVMKMHRLLICAKTKPQAWRNTHSCVIVDRFEDITPPDQISANPNCSRTLAMFGYVRGHPLKANQIVHIPGLDDFEINHVSHQEDPCEPVSLSKTNDNSKLRHLSSKHKRLYAPMCDVGGMQFDDDGIYIHEDADRENIERSGKGLEMLRELRTKMIDEQQDVDLVRRPVEFANEDTLELKMNEADLEASEASSESSDNLSANGTGDAGTDFFEGEGDLDGFGEEEEDGLDAQQLLPTGGNVLAPKPPHDPDTTRINAVIGLWEDEVRRESIRNMFVTGSWKPSEKEGGDALDAGSVADSQGYESIDEGGVGGPSDMGEFPSGEDGSSGGEDAGGDGMGGGGHSIEDQDVLAMVDHFLAHDMKKKGNLDAKDTRVAADEEEDMLAGGGEGEDGAPLGYIPEGGPDPNSNLSEEQQRLMKKKMEKKKAFDDAYDTAEGKNNTTAHYHSLVREVEEKKERFDRTVGMIGEDLEKRIALVGYFSGLYVRVVVTDVPVEFVKNYHPTQPLILGGLNPGEDQMGVMNARVKRHRWFPKILKAQDPVAISIGWRRIQTQPIFATEDANGRLRYLKYTPKHTHCATSFYAPIAPPNTGFILIPVTDKRSPNFRPMATGYTQAADRTTSIVKKLKITGVPQKISKTTAFIKGMFTSDVEAAKFVGAKLKTVSGLRGMIKKVIKGKRGIVRCTFEDKVLMSDICFIRAWKPVDPPRYCATIANLCNPEWTGMRTMAQLRRDYDLKNEANPDSEYKDITRRRHENLKENEPVKLTRATRLKLPFDMKEEFIPLQKSTKMQQRVQSETITVPEPREMRQQALLDVFARRAEAMERASKGKKQVQRKQAVKKHREELELQQQGLKRVKKESARRQEFRSQHKSKK